MIAIIALLFRIQSACAVELESTPKALAAILGPVKAVKKQIKLADGDAIAWYSKNAKGKVEKVAFVEKGIYPPNCTHTWVIGLNGSNGKVEQIRVVEMSCPHAFPTNSESFLAQFRGKGPADTAKLEGNVKTVAKATGSSLLTATAVKRSVTAWKKIGGKW